MKLCVSAALLLLLALTWTRADPIPSPGPQSEECSKLKSLTDKTEILGKFYFLAGFTDSDYLRPILKFTSSARSTVTDTPTGVNIINFNKLNGVCQLSRMDATISGDTARTQIHNIDQKFQLRHLSQNSLIMDLRISVFDINDLIQKLHLDANLFPGPKQQMDQNVSHGLSAHNVYYISREAEVNETDLELFKVHAKCAGFTGELDYLHMSDQEYCSDEESVEVKVDGSQGPESEVCSKLNSLMDKTQFLGQFYFQAAFTDNNLFRTIFGLTFSSWSNVSESQTGLTLTHFNKMNGTCVKARASMTLNGDKATLQMNEMMSEFQLRNLSRTSLIMDLNASSSNIINLLQKLKLDPNLDLGLKQQKDQNLTQSPSDVTHSFSGHIFYLISKEAKVNEADLEQFKAHAKCAGFTGEPNYLHENNQEYCSDEESVLIQ